MHEAGYVHCGLKPPNVMWLPRQKRWTVIDFARVARIGQTAPLSFTLAYAAPEVVAAYQRQEVRVQCSPALDAWSLGVLAFELLTGAPAFNLLVEGRSGVRTSNTSQADNAYKGVCTYTHALAQKKNSIPNDYCYHWIGSPEVHAGRASSKTVCARDTGMP